MSLINQMLQELDKRGAGLEATGQRQPDTRASISDIASLPIRAEVLHAQPNWLQQYALRLTLFLLVGAMIGFAWSRFSASPSPFPAGSTSHVATAPQAVVPSGTAATSNSTSNGAKAAKLSPSDDGVQAEEATPVPATPALASKQAAAASLSTDLANEGKGSDAHSLGLKFAEALSRLPTAESSFSQADGQRNTTLTAESKPAPNISPKAVIGERGVQGKVEEKGYVEASSDLAANKTTRFSETATKPQFRIDKPSSPQQRAENEYMRANQLMQQGKNPEALQALEQALAFDGHHVAARHAMANLLLAFNRQDEAMRRLQLGVQLDPGYTVFAVLLARIQAEKKQLPAAIETMFASLPYATGNADYQALLAALLQRDKRHKEAIEHYQLAVQLQSENGVWWMGLGISLQAENLNAQALEAFQRAKQSRSLNPQLLAFVEQKIAQLNR